MAWLAEARAARGGDAADEDAQYDVQQSPELTGSKALLLARPTGVYTCARAVGGKLVVWRFHLERLAAGLTTVDAAIDPDRLQSMQQQSAAMVEQLVAAAVADSEHGGGDLMVTVLWWRAAPEDEYSISVHACPMPQPKLEGATALVFGGRRGNATCKHSQWVTDRVPIEEHRGQVEAAMGATIQEVILSDATAGGDRLLLEGTVSNLFVVRQDCVVTAQDDVLLGSTRELVLRACADLGIPVVLEPSKLSEAASWQAAFVTSSVRLVMELSRLVWESTEGETATESLHQVAFSSEDCDIPRRIRDHITSRRLYLDELQVDATH